LDIRVQHDQEANRHVQWHPSPVLGLPRGTRCHRVNPEPATVIPVPGWKSWLASQCLPGQANLPSCHLSQRFNSHSVQLARSLTRFLSEALPLSLAGISPNKHLKVHSGLLAFCPCWTHQLRVLNRALRSPIEAVGWRTGAAEDATKGIASVPSVVRSDKES